MRIILKPATESAAEVAIRYGALINAVINFLLVSLVLFFVVKAFNTLKEKNKKEAAAAPAPAPKKSDDVILLEEIRDLLKENRK